MQKSSLVLPSHRRMYSVFTSAALYMQRTNTDQTTVHAGSQYRGWITVSAVVVNGLPMMMPMLKKVDSQLSSFCPAVAVSTYGPSDIYISLPGASYTYLG